MFGLTFVTSLSVLALSQPEHTEAARDIKPISGEQPAASPEGNKAEAPSAPPVDSTSPGALPSHENQATGTPSAVSESSGPLVPVGTAPAHNTSEQVGSDETSLPPVSNSAQASPSGQVENDLPPLAPASAAQPEAQPAPTMLRKATRAPRPDRKIVNRVDAVIAGAGDVVQSESYEAFNDSRSLATFALQLRGDRRVGSGPLFVGGLLDYRYFSRAGELYSANTEVSSHEPSLGLRLAYLPIDGLDFHASLSGGPSFAEVAIAPTFSSSLDYTARKKRVLGLVRGMAGVSAYLPKKWLPARGASRFTLGLDLAFGYTYRTDFQVDPEIAQEEDDIRASTIDYGNLRLRGFSWQVGAFVRFM